MQVDASATSDYILAELRNDRTDVVTVVNVERLDNWQSYPPSAHIGDESVGNAVGSPRWKMVIVCGVALAGAVLTVGIWQLNSRDELSYQAGREAGTSFANSFTALSSDSWSDPALRTDCSTLAAISGRWVDDHFIAKEDIDQDDFIDGCYSAARPIIPR
jgi:hypothetical protein